MNEIDEKNLVILIVDDDEIDRQAISRSISELGAAIDFAKDGEETLKKVAEIDYDCILLDHMLPDYDSIQLIPLIRQREIQPSTPIVVVTGFGNELLAVKMIKSGAMDYIPKDKITAPLLLKSIREAVVGRKEDSVATDVANHNMESLKDITQAARSRADELADCKQLPCD